MEQMLNINWKYSFKYFSRAVRKHALLSTLANSLFYIGIERCQHYYQKNSIKQSNGLLVFI